MYTKHYDKGTKTTQHDVSHILDMSEHSCYWTGFVFANANYMIAKAQVKGLRVNCTDEEKEHLSKLSTYLGFHSHPIHINKASTISVLSIYSVPLVSYLADIGLTQHMKDRHVSDRNYAHNRHFWRGFVDGNGLLDNQGILQLRLQANDYLMADWVAFTGIADYDMLHHKNYQEYIATEHTAQQVVTALYASCTIASPRTWDVAYHLLTDEQRATDGVYSTP